MTSQYFSNKITFLNVLLSISIVLLHAKTPERWGLPLDMSHPFIYWTSALIQMSIPTFFFISGLLFYRACTFNIIERKLKSRIRSLLVPYLIWNTFFVFLFFLMAHIPFLHDKMNMGNVLNSPQEILYAIINSRYSVLWFVKVLMIFCILSAVTFIMMETKRRAFFFLVLSIIVALISDGGYECPYKWFPMYYSGAIMGRFYVTKSDGNYFSVIESLNYSQRRLLLIALSFAFVLLLLLSVMYEEDFIFWFRLSAPIIIWIVVDLCLFGYLHDKFHARPWMKYMFFIICTHQFVLNILQKMVVLTYPPTPLVLNLTYILSAAFVVIFLIQVARILSKYSWYKYLSGGR